MDKQTTKRKAPAKAAKAAADTPNAPTADRKPTRSSTLIALMRAEGGKTAEELAHSVGWQKHSVRGFIAGTLKKRGDLDVLTVKTDGVTRYQLRDRASA